MELSKKAAPAFFRRAQLTYRNYQFKASETALELAVSLDPTLIKSWSLLGLIRLGQLDLRAAKAAFLKAGMNENQAYLEIINKWQNNPITETNLADFIKDLKKHNLNREIALVMSSFNRGKNFRQKSILIEVILEQLSPTEKPFSLQVNEKNLSLKITGSHFNILSLLASSQLRKLDISHTVVTDLKIMTDWKLSQLNISHTKISSIEALKNNPIEHLDISYTSVNDINVVQSLPIISLNLAGLRIKKLAPLLECPELKQVTLSRELAQREPSVIKLLQERTKLIIIP